MRALHWHLSIPFRRIWGALIRIRSAVSTLSRLALVAALIEGGQYHTCCFAAGAVDTPQPALCSAWSAGLPTSRRFRLWGQPGSVDSALELQTTGRLVATIDPTWMSYPTSGELIVEREDEAPSLTATRCRFAWSGQKTRVAVLGPETDGLPHKWRVYVSLKTEDNPTAGVIATVLSSVSDLRLVGGQPYEGPSKYSGAASEPVAECRILLSGVPEKEALQPASPNSASTVALGSAWLLYTSAGLHPHVQIEADRLVTVEISLYAKEVGPRSFTGVCRSTITVGANSKSVYVGATLPWERVLSRPAWRIELRPIADSKGDASDVRMRARVWQESDPFNNRPTAADPFPWRLDLLSICLQCKPPSTPATRRLNEMPADPVAMKDWSVLPVQLELHTDGTLTAAQRGAVLKALRTALGIWLVNCPYCNFDMWTVVRIDRDLWIRRDVSTPSFSSLAALSGVTRHSLSEIQVNRKADFALTQITGSQLYQSVAPGQVSALPVCNLQTDSPTSEVIRIRQALECEPVAERLPIAPLTLALRADGQTECGDSENTIACEADNELLELNTKDYAFCLLDTDNTCVGEGSREVSLVHILLHEAGHWLGLGHIKQPSSIMSSALNSSRCITDGDISALKQVISTGASFAASKQTFSLL